jgi:predicted house-cleaning noncanonical NTP pyrophosphatase (MazG superfamily)
VLDSAGYDAALRAKLVEEVEEFLEADSEHAIEELADIIEVVRSLTAHIGASWDELMTAAATKRRDRGGFEQRYWLHRHGRKATDRD